MSMRKSIFNMLSKIWLDIVRRKRVTSLRAVLHDSVEDRELRYKVELMHEAAENRDILYHEYDVLVRAGDKPALHDVAAYPNPLARHEHREQSSGMAINIRITPVLMAAATFLYFSPKSLRCINL